MSKDSEVGPRAMKSCDSGAPLIEPNGTDNLRAIVADQKYLNNVLSCFEILTILENKGGFMPDEAVMWFREWRARPSVIRSEANP